MPDNPKRLVYIEDEPEMIDLVRLILSRRGFEILGANGLGIPNLIVLAVASSAPPCTTSYGSRERFAKIR